MFRRISCFQGVFLIAAYILVPLNAEATKEVVCAPAVCPLSVCPPCDEPVPGTALWHYMKGIEEIMGLQRTTNAYLANEHFKRAADMDYAPAIKALADSYYSGDGIDKDTHKALLLYIRASDLGDGAAQFNAGVILLRGYAGATNYELAFYYLCLATMNEGLDEMAQDAAAYRDEAGALLTPAQTQAVFRQLINNPATNPHKRHSKNFGAQLPAKRDHNQGLRSKDQPQVTTSKLASETQLAH